MGIFAKLFGRKDDDKKVGGMEDYMTLVRVYFQAALCFSVRYHQFGHVARLACLQDKSACSDGQQSSGYWRKSTGEENDEEYL